MAITYLEGSGMSNEKRPGLGNATPPNNTLVRLILLILDHGGPKTHK